MLVSPYSYFGLFSDALSGLNPYRTNPNNLVCAGSNFFSCAQAFAIATGYASYLADGIGYAAGVGAALRYIFQCSLTQQPIMVYSAGWMGHGF